MTPDVERIEKPAPRPTGVRRAIRRMSPKRRRDERELAIATRAVYARSGGRCEIQWSTNVCTGQAVGQPHHRLPRSAGGGHDPENLLAKCDSCHAVVHANPAAARARGLLLSRYDGRNQP